MRELFGLHGRFIAHSGKGDELEAILLEAAEGLEVDPECLLYLVSRQPEAADAVWVTEVWASRDAQLRSLQDESTRALIQRALPLIDELPERSVALRPVGGKGL